MAFAIKFLARILANAAALLAAKTYFSGFILASGPQPLIFGAAALALLNTFLKPVLRIITAPLRWLTLGLFNIAISIIILWAADKMLSQLVITNFSTLFWTSLIVALANIL